MPQRRFRYVREPDFWRVYRTLSAREKETVERMIDLIDLLGEAAGPWFQRDLRGQWWRVAWGMHLYVPFRVERYSIRLGRIGRWQPADEE